MCVVSTQYNYYVRSLVKNNETNRQMGRPSKIRQYCVRRDSSEYYNSSSATETNSHNNHLYSVPTASS